jgi:hypothetical protein
MIIPSGIRGKVGLLDGARRRSQPPTDCAEALKRSALPPSRRTSAFVEAGSLASLSGASDPIPRSCRRGWRLSRAISERISANICRGTAKAALAMKPTQEIVMMREQMTVQTASIIRFDNTISGQGAELRALISLTNCMLDRRRIQSVAPRLGGGIPPDEPKSRNR